MRFNFNYYPIIVLLVCCSVIVSDNNLSASDSTSIPVERIDSDGHYHPSGLAQKLAIALEKDAVLSAFMSNKNIYVAQIDNKIIIKGQVAAGDRSTVQRIVNIAHNIQGIAEVNVNQIQYER